MLQFNRPLHCVEKDDSDVGCKGLLFFGASQIPKITIPQDKKKQFNLLWEVFIMEMEEMDHLKLESTINLTRLIEAFKKYQRKDIFNYCIIDNF